MQKDSSLRDALQLQRGFVYGSYGDLSCAYIMSKGILACGSVFNAVQPALVLSCIYLLVSDCCKFPDRIKNKVPFK